MAQQEVVKDTQDAPLPKLENIFFLYITVKRAKDLIKADTFGLSDPFCKVIANKQSWRTKTIEKNLNPEWNEDTQFVFFDAVNEITFEVWDADQNTKSDKIGTVTLDVSSFYTSGNEGFEDWKALTDCKSGSIFVKVTGRTIKPLEMEARCEKLEAECKAQVEEIRGKEQQRNELQKECDDKSAEREKLEKEKIGFEDELKDIRSKVVAEQEKIEAKKQEIEKYKTKKTETQAKLDKYRTQIEAEEESLKKEEKENVQLTEEAEKLRTEAGQASPYVLKE